MAGAQYRHNNKSVAGNVGIILDMGARARGSRQVDAWFDNRWHTTTTENIRCGIGWRGVLTGIAVR